MFYVQHSKGRSFFNEWQSDIADSRNKPRTTYNYIATMQFGKDDQRVLKNGLVFFLGLLAHTPFVQSCTTVTVISQDL